MPIFDLNGKKYDVEDKYLDAFSKQNPDAYAIEEREGKRYKVRAKDYGNFRTHFDKPQQKDVHQSEDDAVFEANAERFRSGQPIERVTTQSVISANPELGLQTNAVQPEVDQTQQYIMNNKPTIFGGKKKSLMDVPLNVSTDAIEGGENLEKLSERARIAEHNMKDPFVQKARTEADVRGLVSEIDGLLEKSVQEERASVGGSAFMPEGARGRAYTEANKERVKEVTDLSSAKRLLDQSQYIIDAAKRGDTGILKDTWQGFKDSLEAEDFTFGLADAASSASILDAIKKVENGEELTETEDKLLRASAINMATQYYYANDLNRAYKAGQVSAESVPFMLEMAINPISSLGKASAKTLLNYGLKSYAKQVGKGLAKGAAAGTGMALTTGLGRVAAGTTDRLAEGYNYGVDFDGNLYAEKKEDAMGVGEAVARSLASTAIENQSEMIFNAFKGFGGFMKGVQDVLPGGVNKFFDMLSHNKVADAYRYIKNSPVFRNYLVKDIRNATQIGGLGEEYLEEVYNNIANAAIGEMKWEDVVSLDKNIDTLLGLAPTQVMFGLLGLGGAGAMRYQTRKTLEDLQATMNEQQRKDLEGLLDMGLDAKEVDVRGFIRNVMQNESYTIENKRDLIKAAYNVAKQNGIDELTEADTIDKVNAENALIDSVTDPSTGIYTEITATLPDAKEGTIEVPGYVVGWLGEGEKRQPIFVQEGMDNTYENRRVLKPGQWSEEAVQQKPAEEVKAISEEMIREEEAVKAENEARWNPNVPEPHEGVSFFNGEEEVTIVGVDANTGGLFIAPSEEYRSAQGNEKKMAELVNGAFQLGAIPVEQYKDAMTQQIEAEEKASKVGDVKIENEQQVVRNGETYTVISVDADGIQYKKNNGETNKVPVDVWKSWVYDQKQTEAPTNVVSGEPVGEQVNDGVNVPVNNENVQPKQPTLEEVVATLPKTKNDEIDYKAMTPQQQFQYTSLSESPEVALEDLQADIAAGQEEIAKVQEQLTKARGGQRAELRDKIKKLTAAQNELQSFYDSVLPKQETQSEEQVVEPVKYAAEEIVSEEKPVVVETEKAKKANKPRLTNRKKQKQSEFTDEELQPMDALEFAAHNLAVGNVSITTESFKKETGYGEAERKKFMGLLRTPEKGGLTIEEAAEKLVSLDNEENGRFFGGDTQAARNTIIELLGYEKWGDVTGLIKNNRLAERKKREEAEYAEYEAYLMEELHVTPEEYELLKEAEEQRISELYDVIEEVDAIFAEAELERQNNQEYEQGRNVEGNQGQSELLSEARTGDLGGNQRDESQRGTSEVGGTSEYNSETPQESTSGSEVDSFIERAKEWEAKTGVGVRFAYSLDEVTNEEARDQLSNGVTVAGWYEKSTGEVVMYLPNITSLEEVDKTYVHEVVVHKGLPSLLGEKYDSFLDEVWNMMSVFDKAKYINYPGVASETTDTARQRAAADEYIANTFESIDVEESAWGRITDLIKRFLKAIGLEPRMTNADIANAVKASYANLKSGAEGNVSGEGTKFRAKWRKGQLDKASRTIRRWLENNTRGKSFEIELPKATLDKVRKAMGRDFESHNITSNGIVHALKNHGENGLKLTGISIPLSKEDVELIPYIMTSPDRVEKASTDASGRESVRFYKDLSNGYVVVVEKEYKNSPDDMETITMWAELSSKATNAQQNAAPDTHVRNAILSIDIAKIRKDAEDAIEEDENLKEKTSFRVVKDKNGNKSLVGLHNISEDKLKKAIKQGGLANPSMAVIDMDKQSHVDYGDITLVAPSSLVDKKTGKNIGTYTADAWTPIYPQVEKQMSKPGAKEYSKDLEQVPSELRSKVRLYFNAYLEDGNTSGALNYWFLHDTGKNPPLLTSQSNDYTNEELDAIEAISNAGYYSGLNEEEKQKVLELFIEKQGGKDVFEKNIADRIETMKKNLQRPDIKSFIKKKVEQTLQGIEEYGYDYEQVSNFYANAQRAINNRGKIDEFRTFRNAQDIVNNEGLQGEFDKWLSEKEEQFGVEEYIFVGYNNNGDRKYIPNTLENASRIMKKEGRAGATGLYGFNHFVATLAPNAGSLVQIRKKKGNLSSQEEYKEFVDKWGSVYHDLAEVLRGDYDGYSDVGYYRLEEMPTVKNPKEYVKKEYGIDLSDEFMQKYNDFVSAIKNDFPARYFETKFERPVYLNEFAAAVVPQGTSKDVVDALTKAGLPVEEYENGNNEARMAAVDKVSSEIGGIRFRFIGERGARNLDKAEEATTRLDNLAVAKEMESAEKDSKTIKMTTGWERGADGLWRYEVDDNLKFDLSANVDYRKRHPEFARFEDLRHKYNANLLEIGEPLTEEEQKEYESLVNEFGGNTELHRSRKLKDYVDAPELFEAYPELRNIDLSFAEMDEDTEGKYLPKSKSIQLNENIMYTGQRVIGRVLVHEIQHAIQDIEGFEPGANKDMQNPNKLAQKQQNIEFMQNQLDKHVSERNELLEQKDELNAKMSDWYDSHEEATAEDVANDKDMSEWNRLYDELESKIEDADRKVSWDKKWLDTINKANTQLGIEGYAKVSGEVEARNVMSRLGMTLEQRRNSLASETEDVAREDQIFLKDGIESGLRFRLSEKGKQIQAEVDKFTSKYNSKPVELIDPEMTDEEIEDAIDWQQTAKDLKVYIKESKSMGGYVGELDKILIFVENMKLERMEEAMFHENLHPFVDGGEYDHLLNKLYENGKDDEALSRARRFSDREPKAKRPLEFFNYAVSYGQVNGDLDDVLKYFDKEEQAELLNLLKENGYDYYQEQEGRRGNAVLDGLPRREENAERVLQHQEGGQENNGRVSSESQEEKLSPTERKARLNELFNKVADMGLQGVLGNKEYTSLMVDIYKALPEGVRAEIAEDALRLYGGSVAPAVSDYIGPKSKNSIMDKVVTIVREALRKVGFDLDLNANEVRYMAWRSKKPLDRNNMFEVAEDIDMKYRLKVGEYDGTTPDGGSTRFSVKSKPKTKAELKEEVRDLKEDVRGLKDEVRDLKKQVNTLRSGNKDEWEKKQRAIVSFIKGRLTKEAGSVLGKTRLDQLLTLVNKASTATDLHKPLQFIEQVINDASIEHAASKMDKLIKTKLQGETNRGVAKGVVVDETTRRLFDSIRGTFKDLIVTSIDSELRSVRGEILRFGKEINALPKDDVQGRAILTARQDALKERRKELEKEQEELQRHNVTETKESLERRHDELVEAMDAHIEGEGVWTQEMQDEYDSIPLRLKLAEIRESQSQLDAILADAIMTRRNAYKNNGETRKKMLAEADVIESNYTIAQEELIRLMNEVSDELNAIIKEGKSRLAKRKQALAERRIAIVTMGISAVKDKKIKDPNAILSRKEKFDKWFDNSWLKSVSDFMTAPLNSFNFMLKYIDRNHTIGEGELYNHFMKSEEGALEANNRLYDGLKAYNTAIEEKAKEIFGKDIESVMKDSGKEYTDKVYKQYMYDSSSHKEGEMYPISITKGQALYVWLTWRQDDGRAKLVADGWNDQSIEEIEALIGEDYIKFGEWITDEFFPMLREEKYNKTHIDMFGTSMAKREHYFPFKVQSEDIQEKGEMGESYSGMPSTITGNIIKRTINKSRIKTDQNAFDLLYKYGNDMETWNAMAKLRQDLNFLHSSKAFRNYLEANSKGLFDKFMKAAEVAVKAYNNGEKDAINDFFAKLNRTWAGTNIGFRLNTAMKQILSYPAFMAYSGNLKYQGYLMKYMLNWVGNYKWAKENLPAFRNRVESGDMGMTGMTDPSFDLGKVINKFGEWGMIPNQLVDALTCAAGARSVYDFEYNRAIKAGMSEEEAKNIAQYNAEVAFNETQQSSRDEFVSPTQVSRNVLIKSMMNYQNSNVGYQRLGNEGLLEIMRAKHVYEQDIKNGMSEDEAQKKVANSIIRGTRKMMIAFTILPGLWYLGGRGIVGITAPLISSLFGGGDDDEPYLDDEAKEDLMLSMALGIIAGTTGGQAIASVVQGREYEPMAYVKEFTKIIADAVKDGLNLNTTKNIALKMAKFGGVNVETFENIYIGVEHAIRTGNFDLVDFMFLINLPPSQRKKMAEELYSDMPFMEYAEKVSRAQKLFDDYRKNLPYAKGDKNGSKTNAIKKQYVIENLSDDKQDKLEKEKEFKKLKREYNSSEDKSEWLEDHPEYKQMEKDFNTQEVTKEVNQEAKKLK